MPQLVFYSALIGKGSTKCCISHYSLWQFPFPKEKLDPKHLDPQSFNCPTKVSVLLGSLEVRRNRHHSASPRRLQAHRNEPLIQATAGVKLGEAGEEIIIA